MSKPLPSSTSQDPDERPIKPMRDTSVYTKPSQQKRTIQPRKPLPSSLSQTPKPIQPSPRFESNSYREPPSHSSMSNASQRRPIRIDLIPKKQFSIPQQPSRPRRIIVEEYGDDDDDDEYQYPVTYVQPAPKKIVNYEKVSGMTTRELENYYMTKPKRVVRVRSPPVETIIYRN